MWMDYQHEQNYQLIKNNGNGLSTWTKLSTNQQ